MTRLGFMVEQLCGHVTHQLNLMRHVAKRSDVSARWFPIAPDARDLWEAVPAPGLRVGLRARAALRSATHGERCDALFVHTQNLALFGFDLMRRVPTVISSDTSPLGFHEFADVLGHKVHAAWVERAKATWNRATFDAAARIVTMSEWSKRGFVEHYGLPESKVEVVPIGVDTTLWTPAPGARPRDGIVRFLFVGGFFRQKGGDLLLRWARTTSTRGWEIHVVARDEVPPAPGVFVHRLGNNSDDLVRLAQSCDAFVLPTRADCSSFATVEAMAVGLPAIVTRVGGVPELVANGETGYVIERDDFEALDDRMVALLRSERLRTRMGAAARRRAVALYDVDRNCKRTVDLMKALAAGEARAA